MEVVQLNRAAQAQEQFAAHYQASGHHTQQQGILAADGRFDLTGKTIECLLNLRTRIEFIGAVAHRQEMLGIHNPLLVACTSFAPAEQIVRRH
jgi:hypothetical protein